MDLTRDGNERAFEAIVHRYHRQLLRYCSRLLPAARAEDAVQQAFLSAHRAIHAGDAELNLRPWLYRIAHNASLNLLRQNGFDHDQVSEEIDGVETPPQAFERGERLRTVVAAVQELPDRQRDAIVLQAVEGRSYEEIASELGVSDGAVRQLLNRARTTLREAAAALTPSGFITRIAASGGEAPIAERIAAAVTGAGGGALLVKAGATIVVAGAVASGAATGALPGTGERSASADAAEVNTDQQRSDLGGTTGAPGSKIVLTGGVRGGKHRARGTLTGRRGGGGPGGRGHRGRSGPGGGPGAFDDSGHHGGSGSGGSNSGPGGGDDHSGSGSSGSGGGSNSGSGSSGSGSSGSGSSGSGSSGSGSSGSGSSGSGSSGSGTSGSSGSGTSGSSGSGSSGSGSSGSGTSGSGSSGSSGSGSSGSDDRLRTDDHSGSGSSGSN